MIREGFTVLELDLERDGLEVVREMDASGRGMCRRSLGR